MSLYRFCMNRALLLLLYGNTVSLLLLPNKKGVGFVVAKLVAAVILPHGDSSYDPTIYNDGTLEREAASAIHLGATQTGEWLSETIDPDVLFLSTPHGISLLDDFAVYLGSTASGSVEIGPGDNVDDHPSYTVQLPTIQLDMDGTKEIIDILSSKYHENVTGVIVPSDGSIDMPLYWAEVIPLLQIHGRCCRSKENATINVKRSSIRRNLVKKNSTNARMYPCVERKNVIWSHPLRRYDSGPEMIPELLRLGNLLRMWFESNDNEHKDISIVISGDLSHTHTENGPYGYSNTSALFDKSIGIWASNPCTNSNHLLSIAATLQPNAKSCAFTGLVLLHGILCGSNSSNNNHTRQWNSHVSVNLNATYFGMMVANFTPVL